MGAGPVTGEPGGFYGDRLMVVLVEIGGEHQVLVPLRQFRQYLGVDWASQYQRTKRDEILAREMMSVVLLTRPRWSISRLLHNRA